MNVTTIVRRRASMANRVSLAASLLATALCWGGPAPHAAEGGAPATTAPGLTGKEGEAIAIYEEAQRLYKANDYAGALVSYEKAYAVSPIPEALYGIARCHHQAGRLKEAAAFYERFLADAPGHGALAKTRDLLVEVLAPLGAERSERGDHAGAHAAVARAVELRASAYPAMADPTSGGLLVTLAEILAALGRRDEASATLVRARAASLTPDARVRSDALSARLAGTAGTKATAGGSRGTGAALRLAGILAVGAGAALAAGAGVFGLRAGAAEREAEAWEGAWNAEARALEARGRRDETLFWALGAPGWAALAAGGALLIAGLASGASASVAVLPGGAVVAWGGRFP